MHKVYYDYGYIIVLWFLRTSIFHIKTYPTMKFQADFFNCLAIPQTSIIKWKYTKGSNFKNGNESYVSCDVYFSFKRRHFAERKLRILSAYT